LGAFFVFFCLDTTLSKTLSFLDYFVNRKFECLNAAMLKCYNARMHEIEDSAELMHE